METIIKPQSKWSLLNLTELWAHRELFYIFAWRDIKVRYKQTLIGASWAVFQPLFSMVIFTIFFGNLAGIPSGNLPYSLFVLIGLVYWTFFSGVLSAASNALIENENIIKKIYFPKVILPLSKLLTGLFDFAIAFGLLIGVSVFLHKTPNWQVVFYVPLAIVISALTASGGGLFLAAFNVKYRDVRYALPFFIQMLIFVTPIIYPSTIVRPYFRPFLALNPISGAVESVRSVFANTQVNWDTLGLSLISAVVIFIVGLYYFRSTEKYFADIV